jgi:hypothetical protein
MFMLSDLAVSFEDMVVAGVQYRSRVLLILFSVPVMEIDDLEWTGLMRKVN